MAFLFRGLLLISLDCITTLAQLYPTHRFKTNRTCSNKICPSSDVLFSLNGVSRIQCSAMCARTRDCRSFVYNDAERVCIGCNNKYQNPSQMNPSSGYRYLSDVTENYQWPCEVDLDCNEPNNVCETTRKVCVCTPGYSYNPGTNACITDLCATYGDTYETYPYFLLNHPSSVQYSNVTYQDCINYCTTEDSFTCRSFDWRLDNSSCALSDSTAQSSPSSYSSSGSGSYNHRNCA